MTSVVSVVIPFYNAEKTLREAVESVFMQDYLNIEVILIDDCSTDGSSSIARDLCFRHARAKYLRLAANNGVSKARNIGASESSGDYLTFLDADDLYTSPGKITSVMKIFERNNTKSSGRPIVVYSNTVMASADLSRYFRIKTLFSRLPSNLFVYMTMLPRDFVVPKSIFCQAGGFLETTSLYEDWILRLRLARLSRFVATKSWDSIYRIGSSGLSKQTTTFSRLCVAISILLTEAKIAFGPFSFLVAPFLVVGLIYYHIYVYLLRLSLVKAVQLPRF